MLAAVNTKLIMRKIIILIVLLIFFTALTCAVKFYEPLTQLDISIEGNLQDLFKFIPVKYPVFADKIGYLIMLFSALILGSVYFLKYKAWKQLVMYLSIPVVAFCINYLLKHIIQRHRPDISLQISWVHPTSFSYVSTHTFITFCLFGLVAYYLYKKCANKLLKYAGLFICIIWILITGLCRVLIGVHYPSDVIGAILLGTILLLGLVELSKYFERT